MIGSHLLWDGASGDVVNLQGRLSGVGGALSVHTERARWATDGEKGGGRLALHLSPAICLATVTINPAPSLRLACATGPLYINDVHNEEGASTRTVCLEHCSLFSGPVDCFNLNTKLR